MIFQFEVKGRAALREAIEAEAMKEAAALALPADEQIAVAKTKAKRALAESSLWFKDGSTAVVEIDTDKGTCVVVPA